MRRDISQHIRHRLAGLGANVGSIKAKGTAAMDMQMALAPDSRAPVTGTYELLNPAGVTPSPVRVPVFAGSLLPPVPPGWQWRLAGTRLPAD
jgi:hypothetical protein